MDRKGIIICVDDEPTVVETLKEQLESHFSSSHSVLTASGGKEALELLDVVKENNEVVELIITDQVMPDMKGDEFLAIVQQRLPDTIKILLTGQAGLDSAIKAINQGGLDRYIEKPWDMNALKNDIQNLINKFRQNLENQYLLNNLEARIKELEAS